MKNKVELQRHIMDMSSYTDDVNQYAIYYLSQWYHTEKGEYCVKNVDDLEMASYKDVNNLKIHIMIRGSMTNEDYNWFLLTY